MNSPAFRYSIDASSLISAHNQLYPPDVFPALWTRLDSLMTNGSILAPYDVFEDIKKKDDKLLERMKKHRHAFLEIGDYQEEIRSVMASHPRLVNAKSGKSGSDPMVIALAMHEEPRLTVVTEEHFGSEGNPRIPDVCRDLDIRCIGILGLLRDQKWSF